MLTEKQKTKCFNRAINSFKMEGVRNALCNDYGDYLEYKDYLINYLKDCKADILAKMEGFSLENKNEIETYEVALVNLMERNIKTVYYHKIRPDEKERALRRYRSYKKIDENLSNLLEELNNGKSLWKEERMEEWGGAGVVITSYPDLNGREGDVVVRLKNPKPIVWMMRTLGEICDEAIDYGNKYWFYGSIVQQTKEYIELKGDLDDNPFKLLINIVNDKKNFVKNDLRKYERRANPQYSKTI